MLYQRNHLASVVGMNASKDIIESEHVVLAEAKQRTQTQVGPQVTAFQIAHPQAQLTGAGGKLHEFLALPKFGLRSASPRTM